MPTIRTTMQPDVELDVSDTEYTDLKRQGLLVEDDAPAQSAANPASTPAAAPAKNPAAAKTKE